MAASPSQRSKSTAAGTMGTRAGPTARPWPWRASQRSTPPAASRPNALPPVSSRPCTTGTAFSGLNKSVSRVPGAPPLCATPALAPSGHSTTVQPVGRPAIAA
jgi:hypothetical protein